MQKSENTAKKIIIIKRSKKSHGGHLGGSWKVAYADFVTALMALFLVLWLVSAASKLQKEQLAGYFKEYKLFNYRGVSDVPGTSAQAPPEHQSATVGDSEKPNDVPSEEPNEEKIAESIKMSIREKFNALKDQISVEVFDKGVRIDAKYSEIEPLFDTGSSIPTETCRRILSEIGEVIKDLHNKVAIEGHTDAVVYSGGNYTNWELSTDRASTARKILSQSGISDGRIIRVSGYASSMPLIKSDPNDPRNRRITILLYNENANPND